jgi:CBS domain-containing protein/ribosome-associated translation inhibitor RaiA
MMSRVGFLTVRELLTEPVVQSPLEHVNRAIGLLNKMKAYELFVVEKNEVKGLLTIRDILKAKNVAGSKIASLTTRIPHLSSNDTVSAAAKIMADHRVRAVPIIENGKLVGQIAASSICYRISQERGVNVNASTLMTSGPIFVREDDFVAKARTMMIQKDIDHLPVLRQREIAGVVTSDAIVFRMAPSESITPESIASEKQARLDVKVSGLMAEPVISAPDADVCQVINEMRKRETAYSLVALWGELQGIITYRDCVKLLAQPAETPLPISIVGLPEDPFEAEAAKTKFETVVKRLARSLPDLLEARSVIKTSERAGQRHRYEVKVELITSGKTNSFEASGWSLPAVFDELSDRMKRVTTKKRERPRRRLD